MKKKVLVIDDDMGILSAFEAILESEGYAVTLLSHVDITTFVKGTVFPDIIILDVLLSGSDGRSICKALKKHSKTKHIPIIMISARPNIVASIKKAGADDFLPKPFEMADLIAKVKKYTTS